MSTGAGFSDNVLGFRRTGGRSSGSPPSGTSGGEPPDDMKDRIDALEKGHREILDKLGDITGTLKAIDAKLDAKADAAALERVGGEVRVALSDMRGVLVQKASATDLAKVQGAVDRMPGNYTFFLGLAGFAVTIFVAAGIAKHFGW